MVPVAVFVGTMGAGKTSVGEAVASLMGRAPKVQYGAAVRA